MNWTPIVIIIVSILIVSWVQFIRSQKAINEAIHILEHKEIEFVELNHTIEGITTIIQAKFKNNIQTGKTILFQHNGNEFIVAPVSNDKVIMRLAMNEDEVLEAMQNLKMKDELWNG